MQFGLRYCNTGRFVEARQAVELLQAAEEAGFDSAWTIEHIVVPGGYQSAYPYASSGKMPLDERQFPMPDPLIWMAYVAAATSRIKLATGVIILPEHNPVLCAKQVATLDHMSGGRVILGVGVGWLKEEFDALGVPFEQRGKLTDEYIAAMRELWEADAPCFQGRTVRFSDAYMLPKPKRGRVPIVIGGHSEAAARRAGRLGDGFFPARGAMRNLVELARQTAREHGRDPAALEITVSAPDEVAEIPALEEFGVHRVLVPVMENSGLRQQVGSPEDALAWRSTIERFAGDRTRGPV